MAVGSRPLCIGEIKMTINITELRRLAQAATPGCWYVERGNYVYGRKEVTDGEDEWNPVIACTDDDEVSINSEGNANFIAAANPAAINSLLDRLEAAEKERDNYKLALSAFSEKTEWVQRGVDDGTVSAKYLGWHRADVIADMLKSAESDALEQARLNGVGSEREAALMERLEAAEKERDFAKVEIARLHDDIRELTDERLLDEEERELWATIKAKSAEKECAELRAKIEEMEQQKPGAWMLNCQTLGGDT
jgi:hypothetical protein